MAFLTFIISFILTLSVAIFIGGLGYRIYTYAKTPAPLKIPTMPAPLTRNGVRLRMLKEIIFFHSLFRANKWIWLFGWLFHIGLLGLWARRILVERIRYITHLSDHFMLTLLVLIVTTGLFMKYVSRIDIVQAKAFALGIIYFDWQTLPADFMFVIHLLLVSALLIIFPFSKLLHAPGVFFSPTRNQVDDARDKRHLSPWAEKLEK